MKGLEPRCCPLWSSWAAQPASRRRSALSRPAITLRCKPSELSVRVHPIVFLQRVGAELSAGETAGRPFAILSGNAGISFGPKLEIPPLFEGEIARRRPS